MPKSILFDTVKKNTTASGYVVCETLYIHFFCVCQKVYFLNHYHAVGTGGGVLSVVSLHKVPARRETSVIRIYSYQDKNLQGTFYHPYYDREMAFSNLTRLLFLMDEAVEKAKPTPGVIPSLRFGDKPEAAEAGKRRKTIATFYVTVFYVDNATWQGKVVWAERKREIAFRSALELILLLDSALVQNDDSVELAFVQ